METERSLLPPLLYLVHRIPYPPNKGDKVRSFNILRKLAQHHRVYLGTFVDHPDDQQHVARLGEWCEDVCALELKPLLARIGSLRGLLSGEALSLPYYRSAALREWIERTVARAGIRQAVVFSGPMAQYLDVPGLQQRVIDFCDVDSAKWTQYAADRRWPLSWLYRREGERLLAFERQAALRSDASLFVTAAEAKLFTDAVPDALSRTRVMQNGVDAGFFDPQQAGASPYGDTAPIIVFSGAMDYWPNVDAVCWFANELLPQIRARHPLAQFWIVGMNPAPAVQALANEFIRVTGTVADVRPYIAHADVVVAPLRIARGIQNKVLEAMALARPVVLTAACASGLQAKAGEECEIVADGSALTARVSALLDDPAFAARMGQAARARVLEQYSWDAHLRLLEDCLGASRPSSAAPAMMENR